MDAKLSPGCLCTRPITTALRVWCWNLIDDKERENISTLTEWVFFLMMTKAMDFIVYHLIVLFKFYHISFFSVFDSV